jgi:uncharacterized protein DUF1707/cell wall-active antibiotic response 4TMS protein YvqF
MAPSGPDKPVVSLERERERTIELLSQHFAHDNLSLDELERRLEQVYRASSVPALRDLTRDLPTDAVEAQEQRAVAIPEAFAPEHDRIVSIMAETKRRGMWRAPKRLDVWCIMSDTTLDLTEAQLTSSVTEIHLRAVMAAVKVIVSPGVRVVVQPSAFMSSVADEIGNQPPVGSGAPVVRITGPVVMAELKVVVRRRELLEDT